VERVVRFRAPREVELVEVEERALAPREVRVRTLLSGISAGTELTAYRGSNPYLAKRWDAERRLFVDGPPTIAYPLDGWGYQQVGEVVEVGDGAERVRPGEHVWGVWGHRSGAVVAEEQIAGRALPDTTPAVVGVFARIGAIALNAVLDAAINVGETVAVFGQGVPGLVAAQLARRSGATVVAVDRIARRLELALALGADHVLDATVGSPAETIRELTGGLGADVSIELSGSYAALAEAVRATAYGSRVVAAGFYQRGGEDLRLGEEFHHNRIELVASQISGVAPRLAHRWTPLRLERTIVDLCARGELQLEPLVSHVLAAERAAEAFRLLDERPEETVQVVLDFS
jgi:2-desacetyl-2-hydroxyethyl bacteriochlorophyllide A dehydrogenase